ncbi:DUF1266 domain-containing protein [Novosphingobium terrae]|uniref:DUF1266 domain-containing protein n=1 Tax=Novosphingobium terrae TaxID=2726189 RepID=UPI001980E318|nr:DUF1266 domain-containing protein [Novosphingobium terrae]
MNPPVGKLINIGAPPAWSAAQLWAYALGAPYHVQHQVPLNALPADNSANSTDFARMLKDGWSVEGEEDLLRVLGWLGSEGHRRGHGLELRRYSLWRRPSIAARREELREAAQENPDALEELWRIDAIQADLDGIRGADLIGFDAARAVMVARSGWRLGWLSEERMWDYLLDTARDVQRRFSSWADYAQDFRLSRNMWRGKNDPDHFDDVITQLLKDKASPWLRLPWSVEGLEAPRATRPFDPAAPVWTLERRDGRVDPVTPAR